MLSTRRIERTARQHAYHSYDAVIREE